MGEMYTNSDLDMMFVALVGMDVRSVMNVILIWYAWGIQ